MRKIFLFVVLFILATNVEADNKIQDRFFGCTLGKSTRTKVEKALKKSNFVIVKQDSTHAAYYKGKFSLAGIEFQDIKVKYSNDTLNYISFGSDYGIKNYENKKAIQKFLQDKYNDLEIADSTLFAIIERNSFDTKEIETWARKGNGIIVAAFSTYDYNKCVFAIEPSYSIHYDSAMEAIDNLKIYLASYDSVNAVTGIAGIKFGDDMYTARPILLKRSSNVMASGDQLIGVNTTINGVTYKYAYFTFHREKGLIKATFFKEYNSYERKAAKQQFDAIIKQYNFRYTNLMLTKDEKDKKIYSCGQYSFDYDYPPIFIMFSKTKDAETGNIKYQIAVSYYVHEPDPVYNDEI